MTAVPLAARRYGTSGVLMPSGLLSDLRLACGFVLVLLHRRLSQRVGSARRAVLAEVVAGIVMVAAYGLVLSRAVTSSRDLVTVAPSTLLSFVAIVAVVSAVVTTAAARAVAGWSGEVERLLLPLPIRVSAVRLAIVGVPLLLAGAIATLPAVAMLSAYLEAVDPHLGVRIVLLVAVMCGQTAIVLAALSAMQALASVLARTPAGQLGVPMAGLLMAAPTVGFGAYAGASLVPRFGPTLAAPIEQTISTLPGALVALVVAVLAVVVALRVVDTSLSTTGAEPAPALALFTATRVRGGLADLEARRFLRHANVVSTLGLVMLLVVVAVAAGIAGGGDVADGGGWTSALPFAALTLVPFSVVYGLPAGAATDWMASVSPIGRQRQTAYRVLALLIVGLSVGGVVAGVGVVFGVLQASDVVESVPLFVLSAVVSLWVGAVGGESLNEATASFVGYLSAIVATFVIGGVAVRSGVLDSPASMAVASTVVIGSVGLIPAFMARRPVATR